MAILAVGLFNIVRAQDSSAERLQDNLDVKRAGYRSDAFLAKSRANISSIDVAEAESREGLRTRRTFAQLEGLRLLEPSAGESVEAAMERLRATGRYEFVEPDYIMRSDATPTDPRFLAGEQWALRNIGQSNGKAGADIRAESAWGLQTNASSVVVAVIDSGIRTTHEDLQANLWVNTAESGATINNNVRDDDANGYIDDAHGINAILPLNTVGNGNPRDDEGHGTAVASVIGATGNNAIGMTGVAWNVQLMSLRFLDADGGYISDEIKCIDYAIAKRANIINASFGGSTYSQSVYDAMKRARDAGIIVVCSAGNDASNGDVVAHYPSSYMLDNIVAVANSTRNDLLSASSAYGPGMVELAAPGTSIVVANSTNDVHYQVVSGTSFSTAMVTGAFALLKAKFPNENYRELINRLLRSVDPLTAMSGKTATGGRLNLDAALRTTSTRPFNDDFAQRSKFVGETGSARGAIQYATRETSEPTHAGTTANGSLWWTWTPTRNGTATIETTNSAFDTVLAVYTGTALGTLAAVASNDDQSGATTSKLTFTASAGTAYQIAVGSKAAATGIVALRFGLVSNNDAFASAEPVTGRSWTVAGDNRTATREEGEPRIRNNTGGRSVWFKWVAPVSRRYHISTFSPTAFNSMLGVYTGTGLSSLTEVASSLNAGDSNVTIVAGAVTLNATAGTTYYIAVDNEVSSTGTSAGAAFTLSCTDSEWEAFTFGPMVTLSIASDGTLHGSDLFGFTYGLNPDGSRKWRHTLTGFGTFSSPAVATDGTVYVGDDFNYIHAISADGTRKWRVLTQGIVDSSPAIAPDGTVYVRANDNRLYALNPADGSLKWTYAFGTAVASTYASPAVAADGTVYCAGGDNKMYAINANGTLKWSYATDFIYASPAIGSDGTLYFGVSTPGNRFIALKPDGTLKWDYAAGDTISSSAAIGADGTLYFGCADKKLYALSSTGQLRWTFETGGAIRNSSPVVAADGSIYIGCNDGNVYAIEASGTLRRTYATGSEVRGSPLLHNGRLYIASYDYRLYAIQVGQVPASTAWPMHRQNIRRSGRLQAPALAIGVQPQGVTAEVGDTVTVSVGAVGTGPLTYQWTFNGVAISGATSFSYRVDPVTHASAGQYAVRVTDTTGTVTSSNGTLTVSTPLIPPSIFTPPVAQTANLNARVTFSVTATGTTPMTYQWRRNGAAIAGATTATLTFNSAQVADAGDYTVVVTNFASSVTSTAARLSVVVPPAITTQPLAQTVLNGASATLSVAATGTDVAYQWRRDGVAIAGATSATFKVDSTRFTNAGQYSVVVSNAAGTLTSNAVALNVTAVTRISNLSIRCLVGGTTGTLTVGLTVGGAAVTGTKPLLLRAVGPTLGVFGVPDTLADPRIAVNNSGRVVAQNDDWAGNAQVVATNTAVGAFGFPNSASKDAALVYAATTGSYTMDITGAADTGGVALTEVYDATPLDSFLISTPRLTNVAALTQAGTGPSVLIAGFTITGATSKTVLIRGVGPTLATLGVPGTLEDPKLELHQNGVADPIAVNDDWSSATNAAQVVIASTNVGAFALAPGTKDSALLITLAPGNYTAQLSGVDGTSGLALVEVYEVP